MISQNAAETRYVRRLSDKIRTAFDQACGASDYATAQLLLQAYESALLRKPPGPDRREAALTPLVERHRRLCALRQNVPEPENSNSGTKAVTSWLNFRLERA